MAGRTPAAHVNRLINHLTLMPSSRIYAIEQGDIEWMGWDVNASIAASTHNLIASLIAGLSKGIKVEDLMFKTPAADKPVEVTYPTIAAFLAGGGEAQLNALMHGGN